MEANLLRKNSLNLKGEELKGYLGSFIMTFVGA
jgi:hypothetical protein